MIISVSRRTDIPALYGDWFIKRLRSGEVLVRNPFNRKQISRIPLNHEEVECIVFWTKDPGDFIKHLDEIDRMGFKYYFLFTLNPYDKTIEKNIDFKKSIIRTFKELSDRIGRERVLWRYDPIIVTDKMDIEYHKKWFAYLTDELKDYTECCIISFLDEYKKIKNNIRSLGIIPPDSEWIDDFCSFAGNLCREKGLRINTCAQSEDLRKFGIGKSSCIDAGLIKRIIGNRIISRKAASIRGECRCVESRDIGAYNTCINGCIYCYANSSSNKSSFNNLKYDTESPLLCDNIDEQ